MKKFIVSWDERHSVEIEAETKEEAQELVMNGEFDAAGECAEINGSAEASEVFYPNTPNGKEPEKSLLAAIQEGNEEGIRDIEDKAGKGEVARLI
jgi:hypothetical protein